MKILSSVAAVHSILRQSYLVLAAAVLVPWYFDSSPFPKMTISLASHDVGETPQKAGQRIDPTTDHVLSTSLPTVPANYPALCKPSCKERPAAQAFA